MTADKLQERAPGMLSVAQQREAAEVQAAMLISRANPRDEKSAIDRILQACTRPGLAESALYSYVRGGTDINGPSIRLAETIAQCWGNLTFGIRELEQRPGESTVEAFAWDQEHNVRQRPGESTVEAFAWDQEHNVRASKIFQVPHIRYTRAKGNVVLSDPRDIYELIANYGARRLRACILGLVPGDVIEAAVKQCELTLATKAEVTEERLASLVNKFAEFNVTQEQIEKRMGRKLTTMTPALLVQMGKIYNSLRDGMSTASDWFDVPKPEVERAALNIEEIKPSTEEYRDHGKENFAKKRGRKPQSDMMFEDNGPEQAI